MDEQGLSPERQRRLEELRARYPKQELQAPEPEYHKASFDVILHFVHKTFSQKEADDLAYYWMCRHGYDITTMLSNRYTKEGLRGVTLATSLKGEQEMARPDNQEAETLEGDDIVLSYGYSDGRPQVELTYHDHTVPSQVVFLRCATDEQTVELFHLLKQLDHLMVLDYADTFGYL